ncbi:hypothetical protein HN011_008414 [Eciton burchellii]|nr:hypothetical protein HN011_008414 [Eciton burchellii]
MSFKIFMLFLILGIASLAASQRTTNEGQRCVNGKSYYDGCNHCTCSNGIQACTLRLCTPQIYQPPPADFWENE